MTFGIRYLGRRKAASAYLTDDKTEVQTGEQKGTALSQAVGVLLP